MTTTTEQARKRPQYLAYRVTTWDGELVDEPIASSHHMACLIAYDNYGHDFPGVQQASDLVATEIGEEE